MWTGTVVLSVNGSGFFPKILLRSIAFGMKCSRIFPVQEASGIFLAALCL